MEINVKPIKTFTDKVAVQWEDDEGLIRQSILPRHLALGNVVEEEILYAAPSFGIDWVQAIDGILSFNTRTVAEELQRANIWTLDDIRSRPNEVIAALQRAYGVNFQTLIAAAKKWEDQSK